jgi:uncharacterized membrane protein
MRADSRKGAQKRVDRIAVFKAELAELEREGGLTLTPEQRSGLNTHWDRLLSVFREEYSVDATDSARRVSWGMRVASLLGAAALLAAAILFLHRVWGNVPTPVQVLILTAAPLVLLGGTEIAYARRTDLYYVGLLALAAGVTFVVEMSALGTVLNLTDSPQVLLAWGVFALLVAYAYGLCLLLGTGLVLLNVWSAALVLHLWGYHWVAFLDTAQLLLPGAVLVYCIPWLTKGCGPGDFDFVYRLCGAGVGLVALLQLSFAGDLCCGALPPDTVAASYQILGLLLSAAVVFHGLRLGRAGLVNFAALAFIVFLFVRLHSWWWSWMPKYLFFLMIGLIALGLVLVFRRIRSRLWGGTPA